MGNAATTAPAKRVKRMRAGNTCDELTPKGIYDLI